MDQDSLLKYRNRVRGKWLLSDSSSVLGRVVWLVCMLG
jgi:hypothetical protein